MFDFNTLISVDALHKAGDKVVVVDCSFELADKSIGEKLFRRCRIRGARYLHLDDDLSAPAGARGRHPLPDPAALALRLQEEGVDKDTQVVAYDNAGGPYAARLWWLMRWLGHERVAVLDGGLDAWIAARGAVESGAPTTVTPGSFEVRSVATAAVVDADAVQIAIGTGAMLVIDARSAERFRGDPNPMDPVAGHIPGARNRFFGDNLAADGLFKAPEVLAREFRDVLRDTPVGLVVLQCGSGVTACHNALAMAVAGMDGARLYPGSWSEWAQDADRPVERD